MCFTTTTGAGCNPQVNSRRPTDRSIKQAGNSPVKASDPRAGSPGPARRKHIHARGSAARAALSALAIRCPARIPAAPANASPPGRGCAARRDAPASVDHPSHDVVVDVDRPVVAPRRDERLTDRDANEERRTGDRSGRRALDDIVPDLALGATQQPDTELAAGDDGLDGGDHRALVEVGADRVVDRGDPDHARLTDGEDAAEHCVPYFVEPDQGAGAARGRVPERLIGDRDADAELAVRPGGEAAGCHDPVAPDRRIP